MLKVLKEYLNPSSLEEAWQLFQMRNWEHSSSSQVLFLTGGLSVAQRDDHSTESIIDLNRAIGKGIIEHEHAYEIEAAASITDCIDKVDLPFLKEALKQVGSRQIRNMSSIAGSIAQRYSWSDTLTALLALDCQIELFDGTFFRQSLEEYLQKKFSAILTKIWIPKRFTTGSFFKFCRTQYDIAILNTGMVFRIEEGILKESRIACGSRPGVAKFLQATSEKFVGKTPQNVLSNIKEIFEAAKSEAEVKQNEEASAEYRQQLLTTFIQQGVQNLLL